MRKYIFVLAFVVLAEVSSAQRLIVTDGANLKELNPATGTSTTLVAMTGGVGTVGALAYDEATDTLFAASTGNDSLWRVNYFTGVCTLVGPFNRAGIDAVMHGLEFDSSSGKLYGLDNRDKALVEVNPATGQATFIGVTPLTGFGSIAYDGDANIMYGGDNGTDSTYQINLLTGAGTLVGSLGVNAGTGWAWSAASGLLCCENNGTDSLYRVSTANGGATLIGLTGTTNMLGMAFVPDIGGTTSYTVVEGSFFEGDLTSVADSDNDYLCFFNDDTTLGCIIEFGSNSTIVAPSQLKFTIEYYVTRPGLSVSVALYNYATPGYVGFGGGLATTSDTVFEAIVSSNHANYVGPNGALKSKVSFGPINDEDPAQDGWLHCFDEVRWVITS